MSSATGEGIVQPWMKIQELLSRRLHQIKGSGILARTFFLFRDEILWM